MTTTLLLYSIGAAFLVLIALRIRTRLQLSAAKHRSLTGHARMSRQLAKWIPYYEYGELEFFTSDEAPASIAQRRVDGFRRLSTLFAERFVKSATMSATTQPGVSDMQFVARNRVPFQFSAYVRKHLKAGSFYEKSAGVTITDLDGNEFYDLTGSYGVNVFGYDFYKECIERGSERVRELGPVLGGYHPLFTHNVQRLREISGMDEVSFHMSGTEAVMQAVRLARYHTKRSHVVRFCGAYHGWWGDVQPGVGNPIPANETYTLNDLSDAALHVLDTRKNIACVLVNPLQALHPNANAPGDSTLLDSSRTAGFDRPAYSEWLQKLRDVCSRRNIVLIFDEVFVGFRLAAGGAQEYFNVAADMVTYGKTLGGGLPVGVVCGKARWMRRFDEEHPADICFARGTFNSHPYVMGAMYEFLQQIETPTIRQIYASADAIWSERAAALNERLRVAELPLQISNLGSIWTINYTQPSRYNWMLQYYLRAEGLALSWVGTGRFIFSLNYRDEDFAAVADRIVHAARAMQADGWWWTAPHLTNKWIKRRVLKEILAHRFGFAPPAVQRPIASGSAA